jgi:hypothetical protein
MLYVHAGMREGEREHFNLYMKYSFINATVCGLLVKHPLIYVPSLSLWGHHQLYLVCVCVCVCARERERDRFINFLYCIVVLNTSLKPSSFFNRV